ncbi:hypothetical protein H5410_011658 [Solanum commersonii]|uniref:Uncharacterized protein n=1 Tax=Solanum commersonii TaxID=4109 RepID=A0A9J6AP68_SOLCO|nr:hypothetical protein H5410_011658 [Solanum commersonii]
MIFQLLLIFECFFKNLQSRTQQYHVKLRLNQKLVPTYKSFIAIDESSTAPHDLSVATEGLPVGYILQYQTKLGKNHKFVTIDKSFIATYESSAAPDDSSVATNDLPIGYMLQVQAKLGQNQKFVQTCKSYIATNQLLIATNDSFVTTIDLHVETTHYAKAYNKIEFYNHFNQIRDMEPKAVEHLESV